MGENIYHANSKSKLKSSDKTDPKTTSVAKDKNGRFMKIRGPIHQGDTTVTNVCAPDDRAANYMKQT